MSTSDWIAVVTLCVAVVAAVFALLQLHRSNQIARSQSWLTLRDLMTHYDDVIANFRPGGKWYGSESQPHTVEDWSKIETYIGTFEYCRRLIAANVLNKREFLASYEFRIRNLLQNPRVVTYKLHSERQGWLDFIALCEDAKIEIPEPTQGLPPFVYDDEPTPASRARSRD
jgi:hypothetical protein